jgi:pimeloyl-ACP methyl ester carboxylesterase
MAQVRESGPLADVPLIVLSHDPDDPTDSFAKFLERAWTEAQEELTHPSTSSSHTVVNGSGHNIQLDRPELVIAAIRQIADKYREQERRGAHP